jgi:ATP-dependent DNA helicase RecG
MEKNHSGFKLAELDLKMRGPGEIFGTVQSGFPELKIASWANYDLVKKSKSVAEDVIKNPQKYPKLTQEIEKYLHVA